jgi:hypothetical protein
MVELFMPSRRLPKAESHSSARDEAREVGVALFAISCVEGRSLRLGQWPIVFEAGYQVRIGDEGPGEGYQVDPACVQGFLSRAFGKSSTPDDCSMKRFAHLLYETVAEMRLVEFSLHHVSRYSNVSSTCGSMGMLLYLPNGETRTPTLSAPSSRIAASTTSSSKWVRVRGVWPPYASVRVLRVAFMN